MKSSYTRTTTSRLLSEQVCNYAKRKNDRGLDTQLMLNNKKTNTLAVSCAKKSKHKPRERKKKRKIVCESESRAYVLAYLLSQSEKGNFF